MSIHDRKKDHVRITTEEDVTYDRHAGFNQYNLRHNALPEVDYKKVDTKTQFLNQTFSFPLFISSMTGGSVESGNVNAIIASFCEKYNLPFGVGSQRILLEDGQTKASFEIVRKKAPNAFIASNIGGTQLIGGLSNNKLNILIDSIEADAVIVHLNPLQELLQPEGNRNFKGILQGIKWLVEESPVPILVKETGAGISGKVAKKLIGIGVASIDVAGAGGTSWAKVENRRITQSNPLVEFNNWGLSTVRCIEEIHSLKERKKINLIGSGGIRNSFDIAKALCLGADFTAMASPVIRAINEGGYEKLEITYQKLNEQLCYILTLTGCSDPSELGPDTIYARKE